jgi:glutamate-ammonia-ligase adenylyltransferase
MQRLVAALSAPTAEGILYNTDTRLRPAGEDGPLATSLNAFFAYQRKDAWAWEHMSLIRSRPVYASARTAREFERKKIAVLSAPRDEKALKAEMLEMRMKVEKEFGSGDPWNLKYARGGIMDIMFAAHFLMLKRHVFHPDLKTGLEMLYKAKALSRKDFDALAEALAMAKATGDFLRLSAELPFAADKAPPALKQALVAHVMPEKKKMTFTQFTRQLRKTTADAYAAYRKVMR